MKIYISFTSDSTLRLKKMNKIKKKKKTMNQDQIK